jgi:hypothetical protein
MTDRTITRRAVLKGGATLAGALALGAGRDRGPGGGGGQRPSLVVLWLNGGPAGLFNSAGSFLRGGAFGVTTNNVRDLGNGLVVDAGSLGALPPAALRHMASVNFRHEVRRPHERARAAVLETGGRSQLLRLAALLPEAAVRCAVVNDLGLPVGVNADPPPEAGLRLQRVLDLAPIAAGPVARDADGVRAAYGVPAAASAVRDLPTTFAAVELLVRGGAGVVFAQPAYTGRPDRQFDTHEDDTGVQARAVMAPITPVLSTFLERMLALPGRDVVTVLVGEFSRTVPASDHEPGGTATVIGRAVRTGTAGPQGADGAPPPDAPSPDGLWAFTAAALGVESRVWGRNPHPELIAAG